MFIGDAIMYIGVNIIKHAKMKKKNAEFINKKRKNITKLDTENALTSIRKRFYFEENNKPNLYFDEFIKINFNHI